MTLVEQFKELLAQGLTQADCLSALHHHGEKYMEQAADVDTNDELEVDAEPLFSRGEDGVWVSAWVWVPMADEDEDEDESDEISF